MARGQGISGGGGSGDELAKPTQEQQQGNKADKPKATPEATTTTSSKKKKDSGGGGRKDGSSSSSAAPPTSSASSPPSAFSNVGEADGDQVDKVAEVAAPSIGGPPEKEKAVGAPTKVLAGGSSDVTSAAALKEEKDTKSKAKVEKEEDDLSFDFGDFTSSVSLANGSGKIKTEQSANQHVARLHFSRG